MSRIMAWQCDEDGKIFVDKSQYQKHLRALAKTRLVRHKLAREQREFAEFIAPLHKQSSIRDIEVWMMENGERLMRAACVSFYCQAHRGGMPSQIPEKLGFENFEFSGLKWSELTSNSHQAPKGKEQNWGRDLDLPTGYPGWKGRISFKTLNYYSFDSDFFGTFGIHLGGGGGGRGYRSHEVFIFAEEWPHLFVMEKLHGRIFEGAILGKGPRA